MRDVRRLCRAFVLVAVLAVALNAQGTYYAGIDTSSATFVTDLHNLINPHRRITYDNFDETNIATFASRDTTGGQRAVTCVYTGFTYVYTPPFTWGVFSREHTWCQSWMPSNAASGFESRPEYSDQYHLFPTHQNNANGRRSNHPLGKVVSATYQFLDGKLGTDSAGHTVYEPRDAQKGDAARALFYMAVCYNGVDGYDWTFGHLNAVTLPAGSEAPQDVELLRQWTKQDPPDAWEIARNDYVQSIQQNRNPFVDHPEYVDLIDFITLTRRTASSPPALAPEPSNAATNFTATLSASTAIQLSWTAAAAGSQAPSGYLLVGNTTGTFAAPVDGTVYATDTNLGDGTASVAVSAGTTQCGFSGLHATTTYYFRLYSLNGSGASVNYKTDGVIPSASMTTGTDTTPAGHLVISQVYGGGGNSGATYKNDFIVLFNPGSTEVNVSGWSVQYASATGSTWSVTSLGGSVAADHFYLIQEAAGTGGTTDLPTPDATGTIAMGASAGKVALCSSTTALTGSGPSSAAIVDLVGYGSTAGFYEGSGPAPAPSNTTSVERSNHADDTDDNASDFLAGTVTPHNSSESLPVELVGFTASAAGEAVTLCWNTASEENNYGFAIERRTVGLTAAAWADRGFVAGHGTSAALRSYSWTDRGVAPGRWAYRIRQIDRDGSFKYYNAAEVEVGAAPARFMMSEAYPNPFNPTTKVRFSVETDGPATVKLFNAVGEHVATVFDGQASAGHLYEVAVPGAQLASGMYFCRLQASGRLIIRKLMLVR